MEPTCTLTRFGTSEAARITGASPALQAKWRQRGHLLRTASFDAFDLASILARKMLSDRGVGPEVTSAGGERDSVASWCAQGIMWHALKWIDAFVGDHELAPGESWGAKARWLSVQVLRSRGFYGVIPGRYFVWWADGSHVFHESLDAAFAKAEEAAIGDALTSDPRTSGPTIVLDLKSLADVLQERAGCPLVRVQFPTDPETGRTLPPFEIGPAIPLGPKPRRKADQPERI